MFLISKNDLLVSENVSVILIKFSSTFPQCGGNIKWKISTVGTRNMAKVGKYRINPIAIPFLIASSNYCIWTWKIGQLRKNVLLRAFMQSLLLRVPTVIWNGRIFALFWVNQVWIFLILYFNTLTNKLFFKKSSKLKLLTKTIFKFFILPFWVCKKGTLHTV